MGSTPSPTFRRYYDETWCKEVVLAYLEKHERAWWILASMTEKTREEVRDDLARIFSTGKLRWHVVKRCVKALEGYDRQGIQVISGHRSVIRYLRYLAQDEALDSVESSRWT